MGFAVGYGFYQVTDDRVLSKDLAVMAPLLLSNTQWLASRYGPAQRQATVRWPAGGSQC